MFFSNTVMLCLPHVLGIMKCSLVDLWCTWVSLVVGVRFDNRMLETVQA